MTETETAPNYDPAAMAASYRAAAETRRRQAALARRDGNILEARLNEGRGKECTNLATVLEDAARQIQKAEAERDAAEAKRDAALRAHANECEGLRASISRLVDERDAVYAEIGNWKQANDLLARSRDRHRDAQHAALTALRRIEGALMKNTAGRPHDRQETLNFIAGLVTDALGAPS